MCLCGVRHSCVLCPTLWVIFSTSKWGGERASEFVFPPMCLGCGLASMQRVSSRGKCGQRSFTPRAQRAQLERCCCDVICAVNYWQSQSITMNLVISIMQ